MALSDWASHNPLLVIAVPELPRTEPPLQATVPRLTRVEPDRSLLPPPVRFSKPLVSTVNAPFKLPAAQFIVPATVLDPASVEPDSVRLVMEPPCWNEGPRVNVPPTN